MSGLCKDCKWWASYEQGSMGDLSGRFGDCRATQDAPGAMATIFVSETDEDGDPIDGTLITRRDFGCVQWEAKR